MTFDLFDRILITGKAKFDFSPWQMMILRLDQAGKIDTSFGGADGVEVNQLSDGEGLLINRNERGQILIFGTYAGNSVVWRYTSDDVLEHGFGDDFGLQTANARSSRSLLLNNNQFFTAGTITTGSDIDAMVRAYDQTRKR